MGATENLTHFASPERASEDSLKQQAQQLSDLPFLQQLFDAVTDMVVVLNRQRQIVFCNQNVLRFLKLTQVSETIGLRPGEALKCIHAFDCEGGCGTSEFCSVCGAIGAILTAQSGTPDIKPCRILRGDGCDALDLLVRTTPFALAGERFVICALSDISALKRREALEKAFFHDILNEVTCLKLLSEPSKRIRPAEQVNRIKKTVDKISDEIKAQRDLVAAETGELALNIMTVHSKPLLDDIIETYQYYAKQKDCHLKMHTQASDTMLASDIVVLSRVLTNMVKNAIEACQSGETVTVGCDNNDCGAEFWVHNPGFIDDDSRKKMFQRSFSTKGIGRGLGTYSIKLLTERYLGGRVSFMTSPSEGTTFRVDIPLTPPHAFDIVSTA